MCCSLQEEVHRPFDILPSTAHLSPAALGTCTDQWASKTSQGELESLDYWIHRSTSGKALTNKLHRIPVEKLDKSKRTNCVQKVLVEVKGHKWVRKLPEPTFNKTRDGVNGVVIQARCLRTCRKKKRWTLIMTKIFLNRIDLAAIWQNWDCKKTQKQTETEEKRKTCFGCRHQVPDTLSGAFLN